MKNVITKLISSYVFGKDCPGWHVDVVATRLDQLKARAEAVKHGKKYKMKRLPYAKKHTDYLRALQERDELETKIKNGELVNC